MVYGIYTVFKLSPDNQFCPVIIIFFFSCYEKKDLLQEVPY